MAKPWTLAGVPMTNRQIEAIKKARDNGDRRVHLDTTDEQSVALKARALEAEDEAREMMAARPQYSRAIARRRKAIGMTLDQLAEASGISKANLSLLECGLSSDPTLETINRVSESLGLKMEMVFSELAKDDKRAGETQLDVHPAG